MNSENKVSVIIPCYNAEKFIYETILSVENQTFKDYSICVVNDGSHDDSLQILKNLADEYKNIKILHHKDELNKGASISMNLGVLNTNSEYIAFLDADDLWFPEKMAENIAILESDSAVGLVYSNGKVIDEYGNHLYKIYKNHSENNGKNLIVDCYIRTPSAVMVRRSALEKAGLFNESLSYAYDHDMWIKIKEFANFSYIEKGLMAYRTHAGQQSERRNQWDEGFAVLKDAMARHPYGEKMRKERLAVLHYRLAQHCRSNKKIYNYLGHSFLAFLYDPIRAMRVFSSR